MITRQFAHTIIDSPEGLVLQDRDPEGSHAHLGETAIFGGGLKPEDYFHEYRLILPSLRGALRELDEETDIWKRFFRIPLSYTPNELDFFDTYAFREPNKLGNEVLKILHIFSLEVPKPDFEVYEGKGRIVIPHGSNLANYNLTPRTDDIIRDYWDSKI